MRGKRGETRKERFIRHHVEYFEEVFIIWVPSISVGATVSLCLFVVSFFMAGIGGSSEEMVSPEGLVWCIIGSLFLVGCLLYHYCRWLGRFHRQKVRLDREAPGPSKPALASAQYQWICQFYRFVDEYWEGSFNRVLVIAGFLLLVGVAGTLAGSAPASSPFMDWLETCRGFMSCLLSLVLVGVVIELPSFRLKKKVRGPLRSLLHLEDWGTKF